MLQAPVPMSTQISTTTVVNSGSLDHCGPPNIGTQRELKERNFRTSTRENAQTRACLCEVIVGWTRDINGSEHPLAIKFNVCGVQTPAIDD